MKKMIVVLGLAFCLALSSVPVFAQGPQVCFYEHINYQGRVACWKPGQHHSDLTQLYWQGVDWNDRISSVTFSGGAKATVYEHVGFQGISLALHSNAPDLRFMRLANGETWNWNDVISSLKVHY